MAIGGLLAIVGGAMFVLVTVGSVFLGKRIRRPGSSTCAPGTASLRPAPAPVAGALTGHGGAATHAWSAPGTLSLAFVFLVSFVLYYFINWKYLSTVWPLR